VELKALHQFIIQKGIEKDPRGTVAVKKLLASRKTKYDKLSETEKQDFDTDMLTNPYADSRILFTTGKEDIKSVMIGVDMETPELLLADTLRRSGRRIDLVLTHHPEGRAYATLYDVMNIHTDVLHKFGVPVNIAEAITDTRIREVNRRLMPQNHFRAVDSARLLGLPYMSAHTPADNFVNHYLQTMFDKEQKNIDKVDDVVTMLKKVPEYAAASKQSQGPVILVGSKDKRAGKILVDMTGGTEGSVESIEKLSLAGVGTIVGMHMSDDHFKNSEKFHINVVIAGHIASDTVGLNLLLDQVEKKFGKLDIIDCSGFARIHRG
jgi:hypothetical protein